MAEIGMTRDFFLWSIAAIYLFAFSSLLVQIPGLYGDNGILPARLVLREEAHSFEDLLSEQPTLLRLLPHLGLTVEASMDFLCLGGIIMSFVAMVSRTQRNCVLFAALWMFYFSMFQIGQTFLWFQWDILLLEAGFLCILVAPLNFFGLKGKVWFHQHDSITLWLVKWLLFRLMFASGVVKLTSGCPTWWGLTALNYHYETQCIPTPLSWFAHQLPEWLQKLSVVFTYVIEIVIPFLFFSPVRGQRLFAFYSEMFLMFMIMLTGNYNFFNLLTCALCVSLLEDSILKKWMGKTEVDTREDNEKLLVVGKFWGPVKWALNILVYGGLVYWTVHLFTLRLKSTPWRVESSVAFSASDLTAFLQKVVPMSIWMGVLSLSWEIIKAIAKCILSEKGLVRKMYSLIGCAVFGSLALSMFTISLTPLTRLDKVAGHRILTTRVGHLYSMTRPYRLSSPYGLFKRMTGVGGRPEVIIEGSDSTNGGWKEYNFLYKPGNVSETLPFVAPHQPRLDWQMWFAALGSYQHNPWFLNLIYRLFHNQKEVLELMSTNPFPSRPPKYIRATLYHYHFTKWDEKHKLHSASDWWSRKKVKEYLPIISKDEPSFINYLKQAGLKDLSSKQPSSKRPANYLQHCLVTLRLYIGQSDGFRVTVALFVSALVLSFLDPTLRLLQDKRTPLHSAS